MFARLLARRMAAASAPAGVAAFYMLPHKVSAQERTNSPAVAASPAEEGSLPLLQRLANYVANNPFKTVGGTAIPMYLTIFAYESTAEATRDLPFSQRLIHTRVYGQAIAVMATIAVMTIVNAQTNRGGPFVAPGAKHDGSLERQYSTSAENYGRPSRSRFDMDYGGATPDSQYGLKTDVLVPLIYMPLLPLMIIFLRSRVSKDTLNKVVMATIGVTGAHAAYILFGDSTMHGA